MCLGNPQWRTDSKVNVTEEKSAVAVDLSVDVEGQGSYAITGGADAALFSVDPSTGVLSFVNGAPDFENPLDTDGDNDYEVTVSFTDIRNATRSRTFNVCVNDSNDAPVITSDGGGDSAVIDAMENMAAVTDVNATDTEDSEGDGLTYSISGGDDADFFTINSETGELAFKDAPDFENPLDQGADNMYDVEVTVEDSGSGFDPASLGSSARQFNGKYYVPVSTYYNWTDAQANAQALGGNIVSVDSAAERTFIQQNFSSLSIVWTGLQDIDGDRQLSNINGDDVAYSYFNRQDVTYPDGTQSIAGSVNGASAVALYDLWPNASYFREYGATSRLRSLIEIDPEDFISSDTQSLKINVTDKQANGVDDVANTPKDTPVTIDVLANDSASQGSVLQIDDVSSPLNGTATVNADGTITYTPTPGFAGGVDQFTYSISDGLGETDTVTVRVAVGNINTPPEATPDTAETNEDTAVSIDVLANDSDINNDPLSITSVDQPANGTAAIANGKIVYTPDPDFNGSDTFEYTINDGEGGSSTASVTVEVLPVNDNPVAVDDNRSTNPSQAIVVDVLANDSDVDGDTLTVSSVANDAQNGVSILTNTGQVLYIPNPGFTGTDSFTYTINDGNGGTDTATVTIQVGDDTPPNSAPNAVNDSGTTAFNTPITLDVLGNDSDPENDPLSISSVDDPANGKADIVNGELVYTPNNNFVGTDIFDYTISDGNGGSDTARVRVTVDPAAPSGGKITGQVRNDVDGDGDLSDPDAGIAGVTIQLFEDANRDYRPDGGAIASTTTDANGNYSFDPVTDGTYIVTETNLPGFISTADVNGFNPDKIAGIRVNGNTVSGQDFLDTAEPSGGGSIKGQVRNDVDGDGDLNDPDAGIAGVTIQLFEDSNLDYRPDGGAIASTTTDANGNYSFDTVADGTYIVTETNLPGFISTADVNGFNPDKIAGIRVNDNTVSGQDFLDTAEGDAPKNDIIGSNGDDKLWGTADADNIFGKDGNDTLGGKNGDDCLFGEGGNDVMLGGAGNDILSGTNGTLQGIGEQDIFIGGSGADTFVLGDSEHAFYAGGKYSDFAWISDFDASQDKVQLWGTPELYETKVVNGTTRLFCKEEDGINKSSELVAYFKDNTNIDLNSSAFEYMS